LTKSTGGPCGPNSPNFIRAELLPSGYLIRPCEGGGSRIYIVDHVDLDVSSNNTSILLTVHLSSFAKCASCLYEEIFNLSSATVFLGYLRGTWRDLMFPLISDVNFYYYVINKSIILIPHPH
jgi:hypothetical protein